MTDVALNTEQLKVVQAPGRISKNSLARLDQLIIVIPQKCPDRAFAGLPQAAQLKGLARRIKPGQFLQTRLTNPRATGVVLGRHPAPGGPGASDAFRRLEFAGRLVGAALNEETARIGIAVRGMAADSATDMASALLLGAGARSFELPAFKDASEKKKHLHTVDILGLDQRIDLRRAEIEIEASNVVRWLTRMPANFLDAESYRSFIKKLASEHKWDMKFFGDRELKRAGAGAFLAVTQGNARRDAGIVRLRYRPTRAKRPILSLVGKGIVFDTGGTNLKPFKSMLDMHEDMAGSAVALATLLALSRLKFGYPVDCWLAITENRLSPEAYKSRDVVTASNGKTIEVIHTDAEGRMALADTLALAGREKPGLLIDYATLTGTCVAAVTERYSGVFTNRPALNAVLIDAGRSSGERVWPFPMDADFDDDLKSATADLLQCSPDASGDHILAARFLQKFVPDESAWIHVDLSSASRKQGLAQMPGGPTGFGVRFTLNLLTEHGSQLEALIGDSARNE